VRDCNGFCVGSRGCDRGYFGKGRRGASSSIILPARRKRNRRPICAVPPAATWSWLQGDVSRDEDCRKIVAAAASWGRLDALINNAGTTKHMPHDNLDGLSAEDFQRLFGVNTIGPSRWCGPRDRYWKPAPTHRAAHPSVVNVSSVAGISGIGSSVAYAASRARSTPSPFRWRGRWRR